MKIKRWEKFQHFKNRKPPWIKLYRDILDDVEWFSLPPESAKSLVMLWLIASENDGCLPDIKTISFRLRMSIQDAQHVIQTLGHWIEGIKDGAEKISINTDVYQHDTNVISSRYQNDTPEREGETYKEETETELEKDTKENITHNVPLKRSRTARQKNILSDEDWMQSLKTTEAYDHINVSSEYSKMMVWCQNKNKQPTRTRFINWLNRIEKPLKASAGSFPIGFASKGVMGALERAAALRKKITEGQNEIQSQL